MRIDVFFDVYPHPAKPYFESQLAEWIRRGHRLRLFSLGGIPGASSEFPITFIWTLRERPIRVALAVLSRCLTSPIRSWRTLWSECRLVPAIKTLAIDSQLPRNPPDAHFLQNLATAVSFSYLQCACPTTTLAIYYHGGEIPGVRQIPFEESSRALGRAHVVFSNTRASVREAIARGAPPERTVRIPVGFPLERFKLPDNRSYLPDNCWRFVCLGRMAKEKGFDIALKAFAKLRSGTTHFTVTFIGDGPELANLQEFANRLGLQSNVRFLGHIASNLLVKLLANSDVLVVSSISIQGSNWAETQATVMQEAMLMGAVVVASNIGGIPESLPAPFHRYLYTPNSTDELADRLSSLMTNSGKELSSLGRIARQFVEENYDIRIINERILAKIASANSPP